LAAEQFSNNVNVLDQNKQASPIRRRGRENIGQFAEFVNLTGLKCGPDFKEGNDGGVTREQFAVYEPDLSAFRPMSATPTRNRAPRIRTPQRSRSFSAKDVQEGLQEVREGCINPLVAKTKEAMPSEDQVRTFTKNGQGHVFDCATKAIDLYQGACSNGDHRGDDAEFFMNVQDGANPQAPQSPGPPPRTVAFDGNYSKSKGRGMSRDEMSTEDSIRSRNLRYPDASLVENPVNSLSVSDTNEQEALEEDAASILEMTPNKSDDPQSLRDYRLSLFRNDTESHAVPLSRYSRALQELDHQDGTVGELTEGLIEARESLKKTKKMLKEKDSATKKQQTAVTDLRAKFVTDKQALHNRLQRESEENFKLQTKLSSLSLEVSRLRSNLRCAKTDLKKTSNKWVEESRNEEISKSSGRSSMVIADDTVLVALLRSEIEELKDQLEEVRIDESRTVAIADYDSSDVLRLKSHLERAEVELRRLKDASLFKPAVDKNATEELKAALAKSEESLAFAAEKEKSLAQELDDTKAIIAALEQSHRARNNESVLDVQALKQRLGRLESGAEQARQSADRELRECRMEAEELREDMVRLAEALAEETHRARVEASERVKERMQYEYELEKSAEQRLSFLQKITNLEESLAKAEEDAATRKVAIVKVEQDAMTQIVKRKLDRLGSVIHEVQTQGRSVMTFQLPAAQPGVEALFYQKKREEEESPLKAEGATLSDKLRRAEKIAIRAKGEAMLLLKDTKAQSDEKERELEDLKSQLEQQTLKSGETEKEREFNQFELDKLTERERSLGREMKELKSKLKYAEDRVKREVFRAEEERRMAAETDTEHVSDIYRLKEELELAKRGTSSPTAVESLVSKIHMAEAELEKYRMNSSFESDINEIDPLTALKNARGLLEKNGITSLNSSYEDAPSFISSPDSSISSLDASQSTVATSNKASPLKMPSARSLASATSPLSMSSAMGSSRMVGASTNGFKNQSFMSPTRSYNTPQASSTGTPPSSPPRLKSLASPPSKGTPLSVLEETGATTKFGRAMRSPGRRSVGSPTKKSPTKRLDITDIQRRLLESNERLSAAKSKLMGLVDVKDENKAEQTRIKTSVDDILDTISKQTQKALVSASCLETNNRTASPTIILADATADRFIDDNTSYDGSSSQPGDASTNTYSHARRTMKSTEQVLERYRRYKACRHDVSPGRMPQVVDTYISEDEGEI
jgi:hypothetical protein